MFEREFREESHNAYRGRTFAFCAETAQATKALRVIFHDIECSIFKWEIRGIREYWNQAKDEKNRIWLLQQGRFR